MSEHIYLQNGTELKNRYVIQEVIGAGGFGITYKAWDKLFRVCIAVKEYYPVAIASRQEGTKTIAMYSEQDSHDFNRGLERFLEEARELAKFNTIKNVVSVSDFFNENNTAYMIMEFLDGMNLKQYIRHTGKLLDEGMTLQVAYSILDALNQVHRSGVVHRDISPDNIFLCSDGTIKLIDFGAAKQADANDTKSVSIVLKQGYAPPEQYSSKTIPGPALDIYAFGATLYIAVTGTLPDTSVDRLVDDTVVAPIALNPNIPKYISDVIMKAMQLKPADRYSSVVAMATDLKNGQAGQSVGIATPVEQVTVTAPFEEDVKTVSLKKANEMANKVDGITKSGTSMTVDTNSELYKANSSGSLETKAPTSMQSQKKSKKGLIIGLCSVVAVCIAAAIVVVMYMSGTTVVPEVKGLSVADAEAKLTEANLKVEKSYDDSDTVKKDYIISATDEGDRVKKDTTIEIVVSTGKNAIVTNVIGKKSDEAIEKLTNAGLEVSTESEYSNDFEKDIVISQSIEDGEAVTEGEEIMLVVSLGAKQVKVPNLLGKSQDEAKKLLADAGLDVGNVEEEYSSEAEGTVIAQKVDAEKEVDEGSKIAFTISKGEEPTTAKATTEAPKKDKTVKTTQAPKTEAKTTEAKTTEAPKKDKPKKKNDDDGISEIELD